MFFLVCFLLFHFFFFNVILVYFFFYSEPFYSLVSSLIFIRLPIVLDRSQVQLWATPNCPIPVLPITSPSSYPRFQFTPTSPPLSPNSTPQHQQHQHTATPTPPTSPPPTSHLNKDPSLSPSPHSGLAGAPYSSSPSVFTLSPPTATFVPQFQPNTPRRKVYSPPKAVQCMRRFFLFSP